jgi:tetratricopeptide (TPR) repeat protein
VTILGLALGLYIANRQRAIAQQRFMQVRQLANRFIELDEEIRGIAGTTKVRGRIVSDALQYLAALGSEIHGDDELALEIVRAYVRVAHAQGDPTSSNLGQFSEAEASLQAAERFVEPLVSTDPANLEALAVWGTIAHDRMILADNQGRRDEALAHAATTVDRLEALTRRPGSEKYAYGTAYFYGNVAGTYAGHRRFDEAVRMCRRALDISDAVESARGVRGGVTANLANALWQSGDLEAALRTAREALAFVEQKAAGGHVTQRANVARVLRYEGMILGKADGEPSLGRADEALIAFHRALDISDTHAEQDPNDFLSRRQVATIGLEIGNILRHRDPTQALAMYDRALTRLREATSSAATQRVEAALLAESSYAARALHGQDESKRRIDAAFDLLRELEAYPADGIEPQSEPALALRALAVHYDQIGQPEKAVETYRELLAGMSAWPLDVQNDLRDATSVSRTWSALATVLRRIGRGDEAAALDARRTELSSRWERKLPGNEIVLRQIAGAP